MVRVQGLAEKSTGFQDVLLSAGRLSFGPHKATSDGSTASTCDNSDASGILSGSEFESPVADRSSKSSEASDWSVKDEPSLLSDEKQSLCKKSKNTAHTSFDYDVIWACCEWLNIVDLVDDDFINGCLEMLSMLHQCEYTVDVTVMSLAVALIYGEDGSIRRAFDDGSSKAFIRFCMHVYLAHTYLVDDPCFLDTWHSYLFREHCKIDDLNRELLGILRERKNGLRVEEESADIAYQALSDALKRSAAGLRVHGEIAQNLDDIPTCAEFTDM
jgi:hypothetical protein